MTQAAKAEKIEKLTIEAKKLKRRLHRLTMPELLRYEFLIGLLRTEGALWATTSKRSLAKDLDH